MVAATIIASASAPSVEHRVKKHTLTHIPIVNRGSTIADVQALLWKHPDFDTVKFIYVVNTLRELVGIVSFRDLFRHTPQTVVDSIMETQGLVSVPAHEDDERATHLALRHGLQSIPVIEHGKLIGVIPSRYLLQIFKKDAVEDVIEAQTAPEADRRELDNVLELSILTSLSRRLPWLLVGLVGGIIAAYIIVSFETLLAEHIILASFIPLVVYLSGAISAQVQMFYIRDLAVYDNVPMVKYVTRHSVVILGLGVLVAVILFIFNVFSHGIGPLPLVVSIATIASAVSAIVTGLGVPFILSKFLKDPASATPPIAIIASDVLTVFLYFSTAEIFL